MQKLTRHIILILTALTISTFASAQTDTIRFEVCRSDFEHSLDFIPSKEGQPNIRYISKYVAVPHNADFSISVKTWNETTTPNTYIEPAPKLATDYDTIDYKAFEDADIYNKDEFFPKEIVTCKKMQVRNCSLLLIGVAAGQFNPVRKETKAYDKISVCISVKGKKENDNFSGENWNEILRGIVINPEFFDEEHDVEPIRGRIGCNYLIVIPDNSEFMSCAEILRNFREEQGIMTKIVSLRDIGSNKADSLKLFFKNAVNTWSPAPEAILLLGDYKPKGLTEGITSYSRYDHPEGSAYEPYLTDNQLVDFNNDFIPDVVVARMPAADADEARLMIEKTIAYERYPSGNHSYYNAPITAMGYQKSRWFQLCTEILAGYWKSIGKQCVSINAIYEGIPDSVWSTAMNTNLVMNKFGPDGLNYVPAKMSHLTDWSGNDQGITNAINSGGFMMVHRDHGTFETWGKPYYSTSCISNLRNDDLTFVVSANCQTGHFGYNDDGHDCFSERFLRVQNGAVAVIAASQLSFSFVNDTYVWGLFDYLYPDFMPDYGPQNIDFQYPAFANAYGKLFLKLSSFNNYPPYINLTNNLFHYFGDAYLQLNSEMPEHLTVTHVGSILPGQMSLIVYAENDTHVAISSDNQLIAKGKTVNGGVTLRFNPLDDGTKIKVVATKQNHYRHESFVMVTSGADTLEVVENGFEIFPNPSSDKITICGKAIQNIKIFNILGCKIEEINCLSTEQIEVDVSNLKDGIYVLEINDSHARKVHKTK